MAEQAIESLSGAQQLAMRNGIGLGTVATTDAVDYATAAQGTKVDGIEELADVTDAVNVGSSIHGASAKTTPVDADTFALIDSEASNVLKKLSWTNIKATLKTYFDSLYATPADIAKMVESDTTGITGADAVSNIVSLTTAEFSAIGTPDADTIYYITDAA